MAPKGTLAFFQTYLVGKRCMLVGVEQLRRSPMLRYQRHKHLRRGPKHRLRLADVLSQFWLIFNFEMAYLLQKRN